MREYTIKLSEEEIKRIEQWFYIANEHYEQDIDTDIIDKIKQTKQKPYTNFDKVKDEMTIDDYLDLQHLNEECYKSSHRYKEDKEWLESEVKE